MQATLSYGLIDHKKCPGVCSSGVQSTSGHVHHLLLEATHYPVVALVLFESELLSE